VTILHTQPVTILHTQPVTITTAYRSLLCLRWTKLDKWFTYVAIRIITTQCNYTECMWTLNNLKLTFLPSDVFSSLSDSSSSVSAHNRHSAKAHIKVSSKCL